MRQSHLLGNVTAVDADSDVQAVAARGLVVQVAPGVLCALASSLRGPTTVVLLEERLGVAAHQQHRHLDPVDTGLRALAHRGLTLGVLLTLAATAVVADDEHRAAVGMVVGVVNQLSGKSPSCACAGRTVSRAGECWSSGTMGCGGTTAWRQQQWW